MSVKAPEKPTIADRLAANPIALLTIAGAFFYVALRFAYQTFYGDLRLTPEDVGLTYGDALVRAAGAAVYVALLIVGPTVALIYLAKRIAHARGTSGRPLTPLERRLAFAWLVLIGLFYAALIFYLLRARAEAQVSAVKAGKRVTPFFLLDTGIRAERAKITWVGDPPSGLKEIHRHRLMILGEAGGSVVLYDVDTKRSLRIPASNLAVSILH